MYVQVINVSEVHVGAPSTAYGYVVPNAGQYQEHAYVGCAGCTGAGAGSGVGAAMTVAVSSVL